MTNPISIRCIPSIGLVACLMLAACGGGNSSNQAHTQTMTKTVTGESCNWKLENTSFAADLQAIHQSGMVPDKLSCKANRNVMRPDICHEQQYWFEIFIEVPPWQVDQAQALGYTHFEPTAEANFVDFKCLP